jgi:hypothetical protein
VIARGWAGPSLLAMILFEKYGQHQPLNRQAERYAKEGVPLSLSTLADQVGACCAPLSSWRCHEESGPQCLPPCRRRECTIKAWWDQTPRPVPRPSGYCRCPVETGCSSMGAIHKFG